MMHSAHHQNTTFRPVGVVTSALILLVAPAIANDPPPEIDPLINELPRVDLFLTPENPTAEYPGEDHDNLIHPRGTQEVRVTIDKTGTVGNAIYQLKGSVQVETDVTHAPQNLWSVPPPTDEGEKIVQTLTITNTAPNKAKATATISCVWVRQGGGGGGGGALTGTASYEAWLEDSVVVWDFEKDVTVYSAMNPTPETSRIEFCVVFYDTACRMLTSNQITDISYTSYGDPGDSPVEFTEFSYEITHFLTTSTNYEAGSIGPKDLEEGAKAIPIVELNDGTAKVGQAPSQKALLHARIRPDEGMAGVVGDMIPSTLGAAGQAHFVSPKKTEEIDLDHVILRVLGVTEEEFDEFFEWNGDGEAVPGHPLKRRVSRNEAGKFIVRAKPNDQQIAESMINVWIVWTDITVTPGVDDYDQDQDGGGFFVDNANKTVWRFVFKILPETIISDDNDRPALNGASQKPVPGVGKPHVIPERGNADTAPLKWDASRKMSVHVRNPGGILRGDLGEPVALFTEQPATEQDEVVPLTNPVQFPQAPEEGNDDTLLSSQNNNPYAAWEGPGLQHGIGEISAADGPSFFALNEWGENGMEYAIIANFKEFARVQLWDGEREGGRFWFRISDYSDWHHAFRAKFSGEHQQWLNDGSSSGSGHVEP